MTQRTMDEPISDGDRQRYADWLKAEIELNDSYHNHKETMAWVATAFYLPAVLGLAYGANGFELTRVLQIVLSVALAFLCVVVLRFLHMQFTMRWEAADIAVGLRRAMARVCDSTTRLSKEALELDSSDAPNLEAYKGWPQFIRFEVKQEYDKSKPKRTYWNMALAVCPCKRCDPRLKSEIPTYITIFFATVVAIILVWVDC